MFGKSLILDAQPGSEYASEKKPSEMEFIAKKDIVKAI